MKKIAFLAISLIGVVYLFSVLDVYISILLTSLLLLLVVVAYSVIINKKDAKLSVPDNDKDPAYNSSDTTYSQGPPTLHRANSFLTIKEYDDICNMEISGQSKVQKLEDEVVKFKQRISKQQSARGSKKIHSN